MTEDQRPEGQAFEGQGFEGQGFESPESAMGRDAGPADNPYAPPPPGWQAPVAAPPPPPPPYGAPPGWQPGGQPPPPYGAPPPPYGATPPPYNPASYPGYPGYSYPAPQNTNGFSIAALLCSIFLGVVPYVGAVLGLVFGIIGLRQCQRTGDRGRGLAIAGIVIGSIGIALWTLIFLLVAFNTGSSSGSNTGNLGAISLALGH